MNIPTGWRISRGITNEANCLEICFLVLADPGREGGRVDRPDNLADVLVGLPENAVAANGDRTTIGHFGAGLEAVTPQGIVPVAGGVLIKSKRGDVIGAVGISGDTSDMDQACAVAGIEAAGLEADPG